MNDPKLETLLLASRPYETGQYSPFTEATMTKIRQNATFSANARRTDTPTKWSVFMKHVHAHKAMAIAIAVISLSIISFSGYAHAHDTNPFSLLKRWITGDEVHVTYEGREFKHGKGRTYSDAAVTAFAELRTIDQLAYHADNAYMVPKDGIEHVGNPYYHEFIYPWVGTIERTENDKLIIRQQYKLGDKIKTAETVNEPLVIPLVDINTYIEGEPAAANKMVGKPVVVHTRNYLRYQTGSKRIPQPVIHQYAFALNHGLENVKESDKAWLPGQDSSSVPGGQHGLYEASWSGALSNLCLNNAANHCSTDAASPEKGESFFKCVRGYMQSGIPCGDNTSSDTVNPSVIPFGEAVPDSIARTAGIILRGVEGKVTALTSADITLKTSSGQTWKIALSTELQEAFSKRTGRALKVGDLIGGSVVSSVNDLDNRTFDNAHTYTLKRY